MSNECLVEVRFVSNDANEVGWGVEGVDWFVMPGQDPKIVANRITIPSTKNPQILEKYGNVALPWKPDNEITQEDLRNIFTINANLMIELIQWDFGNRKISSRDLALANVNWLLNDWKYMPFYGYGVNYPWFSTKPAPDGFDLTKSGEDTKVKAANFMNEKVLAYDWKVKGTRRNDYSGTIIDTWIRESKEREFFKAYLASLLSRVNQEWQILINLIYVINLQLID